MLRSSRSVCANLAEAWQKRRYKKAFVAKLNEVEAEAAEIQTWLVFAILCDYLDAETGQELFHAYSLVLAATGKLIEQADGWAVSSSRSLSIAKICILSSNLAGPLTHQGLRGFPQDFIAK